MDSASSNCRFCGSRGNLTSYTAGFMAGMQWAAFETYAENILATQAREAAANLPHVDRVADELDHAIRHQRRWRDWPDGDDHLIRGDD